MCLAGHQLFGLHAVIYVNTLCLSILCCHYKLLSMSFSLFHLANRYGSIYHTLSHLSHLLYLPLISIAQYNAGRAADKLYRFIQHDIYYIGFFDVLWLTTIGIASYTMGRASKLTLLGNPKSAIIIHEGLQHIRRGSDDFPCRQKAHEAQLKQQEALKKHV